MSTKEGVRTRKTDFGSNANAYENIAFELAFAILVKQKSIYYMAGKVCGKYILTQLFYDSCFFWHLHFLSRNLHFLSRDLHFLFCVLFNSSNENIALPKMKQ